MSKKYNEEFLIQRSKNEKKLNSDIQKFREEHPNYEIFNISASGTGGQYGGSIRFWIIWRLKANKQNV